MNRIKTLSFELKESLFLWLANYLPRLHFYDYIRPTILSYAGMTVGKKVLIRSGLDFNIGGIKKIKIGDNVFINSGLRISASGNSKVTVGNNVLIGPKCQFETTNHDLIFTDPKGRGSFSSDIQVDDEVWIGAGCIILPGVTLGKGSVIAAGAVVTQNVEPYTLVGGVPAKIIKVINTNKLGVKTTMSSLLK